MDTKQSLYSDASFDLIHNFYTETKTEISSEEKMKVVDDVWNLFKKVWVPSSDEYEQNDMDRKLVALEARTTLLRKAAQSTDDQSVFDFITLLAECLELE